MHKNKLMRFLVYQMKLIIMKIFIVQNLLNIFIDLVKAVMTKKF